MVTPMEDRARERFLKNAEQPRSWFRIAEELLGSARLIWEARIEPACIDFLGASGAAFPHMRGFYVLAGFSAENFIKGVCVARLRVAGDRPIDEQLGKLSLSRLNTHHDLLGPARQASLPLGPEHIDLLTRLEPIIKWSGRYPVARTPTGMDGLDHINADDLRTLDAFAQLCRDTWRDVTKKPMPGGGWLRTERYEE